MKPVRSVRPAAMLALMAALCLRAVNTAAAGTDTDVAVLTEQEMKRGKILFLQCRACHALTPGDNEGKLGPSLANVFGRSAGSAKFFSSYSSALSEAEIEWNRETISRWLSNPAAMVPGTSMVFAGMRDEEQRELLVRYLEFVTAASGK